MAAKLHLFLHKSVILKVSVPGGAAVWDDKAKQPMLSVVWHLTALQWTGGTSEGPGKGWAALEFFHHRAPAAVTELQAQIKGLGLTFVPHCTKGHNPWALTGAVSKGKALMWLWAPLIQGSGSAEGGWWCSFYICQELDEQGKECASPSGAAVTGSAPALAWPPAPVTCLSSKGSLWKSRGKQESSREAAAENLQGKEPAPNVHPL